MDEQKLEAQAQTEEPVALTDGNTDGDAAMNADEIIDVQSEPAEDYEAALPQACGSRSRDGS